MVHGPLCTAVIVIGDFDVNMMENKIKKILSPLPKAQHPVQKEVYSVPDNREPLVGISTDPDAGAMVVRLMYKLDLPSPSERQTVKLPTKPTWKEALCRNYSKKESSTKPLKVILISVRDQSTTRT